MKNPDEAPPARARFSSVLVLAIGLHLALGIVYVVSGLIVPIPYLFLLWAGWGVLFVSLFFLARGRPGRALLAPAIAAVFYLAVVLGLGTLLDWTA